MSAEAIEAAGVPKKSIDDSRAEIARAMEETRGILAPPDVVWTRWQRWLANDAIWPRHLALVHGDLHRGNVVDGPAGPLLTDFELTGAGGSSYDAAPAVTASAASR